MLSHVQLFVTPWTVAHQAPLSMGFPRQEYWTGLPFHSGIFLIWELNPHLLCLLNWQADSLPLGHLGSLYHTTEKVKLLLSDFSINRQCYTRLRNYTAWHRGFLSPSSQKGVQTYCLSDARRKVVPSHLRLMPRSWADLEKNKQLRCWKLTEGEDTQAGWGCTQDA